ncbi:MAG: glutaredoxin-like protein NrdH [Microbacterium sp.]
MNTITVYSKPSCVQCNATYRALDAAGISYEVVNLTEHPEMVEYIKDLDPTYMQAPVVVVDEHDHWSGFRPDNIDRIARNA